MFRLKTRGKNGIVLPIMKREYRMTIRARPCPVSGRALFFAAVSLFVFFPSRAPGEEFSYRHDAGDMYRIISRVKEDVYVDRRLTHRAEILNRIAVEVTGVTGARGRHRAVFQTSERASGENGGRSFQWAREYESEFDRDRLGRLSIDRKYYMPVVRNVPVFPERELKPGDTWTAEGHEMHDFRDSFGIEEPYRIPFTARYSFLGEQEWQGIMYPAFSVTYRISAEPAPVKGRLWPRRIRGASDQVVFWDRTAGQPKAYREYFRMIFELSDGRTVEYRGEADAELAGSSRMNREELAGEIRDEIRDSGIPDASVRIVDEGITISLENIQFLPDSAVLSAAEKGKLDRIGEILLRHAGRDILVSGHTAMAGTEEGRARLSRERAAAVADYLISKGVRGADRVVVRGFGAERPLADNRTEEGMRRNRRVEITILEN
jgi:outer membrane protein OmpA-like peptidoglycan-associated protein